MLDFIIKTERLGFRPWKKSDHAPFIEMCQDPEVMRYFVAPLKPEETLNLIQNIESHYAENGFCFFALERLDNGEFIGFTGLKRIAFESDFTPGVEIGWRLKQSAWNKGYATEAAKACLQYAFDQLGLDKIYAFTTHNNSPSENVMKKVGMHKAGEFSHPNVPKGHLLERHLLYRIDKPAER